MSETSTDIKDWDDTDRNPAKTRRAVIITIVVLAILLALLFGWRMLRSGGGQMPAMPPTKVAAMVVRPQNAPARLEAVASLSAVREVMLSAEAPGRVSAIRFEAGRDVGSGALLVQLNDGPLRADLKAAKARAEFARLQVRRSEEIAPTGAEPRELLEQRRSQLQQAEAEIEQIEARIRQLQVRAPFAGRLGIRQIDPGQYLNAGEAVATLTALDRLYVDFTVPQQELRQLSAGQTVELKSDAFPDRSFTARISTIEPRIDESTRNVRVQATLSNPDRSLRPGMYVSAAVVLPAQQDALIVPATAVQTSAQGNSVIAIRGENPSEGGQAEIVPVVTGRRIGDNILIASGLKAGDVILTQGQLRVQPGSPVEVTALAGPGAN